MIITRHAAAIAVLCLLYTSITSLSAETISLIPKPASMVHVPGEFRINGNTVIIADAQTHDAAILLAEDIGRITGGTWYKVIDPGAKAPGSNIISVSLSPSAKIADEGYTLDIKPKSITLKASKPSGLFYGMQTLMQMCIQQPLSKNRTISLPCMRIDDKPAFEWRGLMLDCSRTFLSIDYLKRYIDLLSKYKMNVLHLHLTDDQGWRLEIKKYPKLTTIGAQFADKYNEPGGYYTQAQMKDLVAYAQKRGVTLVPEIEMPGHSLGALTAYPELSCFGGPLEIHPYMQGPGIHYEVFCIGNPDTLKFFEDVLNEVIEIFPSKYIHIGGDEVPRDQWSKCPKCQALMKVEGLKNESELQSWFTRNIEQFLLSKNRQLIGWDEIMEGGLSPKATVMSWRGVGPGIEALKQGHDVVFAPTSHCYFDYQYEVTSVEKTYSYNPVPQDLPVSNGQILGVQACMWTHIARTEPDIDRQILPRLLALSEVAWSNPKNRDFNEFSKRLVPHLKLLGDMKFSYHKEPGPAIYRKELVTSFDFEGIDADALKSEGKMKIALNPDKESLQFDVGLGGNGSSMKISADSTASGIDKDRLLDFKRVPFMVEFWVRHRGQADRQYGSTIVSYGDAGSAGWRIGINGKNEMLFSMYGIYDLNSVKSIIPADDKWHHAAVNVRRNHNLYFYIDGKLTDKLDVSWIPMSPANPLLIIGNDSSRTTPFTGSVDRIRVSSGEFRVGETDASFQFWLKD